MLSLIRTHLSGARTLTIVAVLGGLAFLGLFGARSWLAARDANVHLAATIRAQEQLLEQANDRQRRRDADLGATLAQLDAAKRRVNTPAKAAAEIPQALPPLPEPIDIQLPPPTLDFPAPPAVATIPQADLKPLYDHLLDCRTCEATLAATRDNLTDERAKFAAVTVERDAAVQAARGGSFWSRLRSNAKWFAIGAALGAVIATTTTHP